MTKSGGSDLPIGAMRTVVRSHMESAAPLQQKSGAILVADANAQKLLEILEPLDDTDKLLACEGLTRWISDNNKQLGAVGGFNREFMRLLVVCDPDLATRFAAHMRAKHSAAAIPHVPFHLAFVTENIRTTLIVPYLTRFFSGNKSS